MSFELYKHEYQGKTYGIVITRKARIEIEELGLSSLDGLNDPQLISMMMKGQDYATKAQALRDEGKEDEAKELEDAMNSAMAEMLPHMKEITRAQNKAEDEYEIFKICLRSYISNGDISDSQAEEILVDWETKVGPEKFTDMLLDVTDKVFTQIAKIRDHKQEIFKKTKVVDNKTIPMS